MLRFSHSLLPTTLCCLALILLTDLTQANEAKPPRIKVMSYNIHYGIGMDKKKDLARISKIISDQNPDIVGLQEIGNREMAKELGKLTGMAYVFGPSLGKDTGYGDAILSKHPFKWVGNLSIPSASSSRYQAMAVDVDLSNLYDEGTTVRFINTHFDWLKSIGSQEARLATVNVIERAFMQEHSLPSILAGDLNATPSSPPLAKLAQKGWYYENLGKTLPTIGAKHKSKQIDYLLLRPKKSWMVHEVQVLEERVASDHLPIVMTLSLATQTQP
ncbi:endonuclease/exonuclease/phosphatase family protein [Rubritalea tangerina]|uniref:Endonuclease/exonuclease/phosphatase family protein n=2 Tax=Rubritalea tangerina TaxID=430798 RepID=A0ABW4ZDW5_9BACT